jgi:hypothetical protein
MPKRGKVNRIWNSEGWEGKYYNGMLSCIHKAAIVQCTYVTYLEMFYRRASEECRLGIYTNNVLRIWMRIILHSI